MAEPLTVAQYVVVQPRKRIIAVNPLSKRRTILARLTGLAFQTALRPLQNWSSSNVEPHGCFLRSEIIQPKSRTRHADEVEKPDLQDIICNAMQ